MDLRSIFSQCTIVFDRQVCQLPNILSANSSFLLKSLEQEKSRTVSLRACLKSFDKREGKADNKGKQAGDDGECVNIQAISAGKSMKRYERI